jgi:hypothetical protein
MLNRAPVLTLWAAVVAVLGFEHDEALTRPRLGRTWQSIGFCRRIP